MQICKYANVGLQDKFPSRPPPLYCMWGIQQRRNMTATPRWFSLPRGQGEVDISLMQALIHAVTIAIGYTVYVDYWAFRLRGVHFSFSLSISAASVIWLMWIKELSCCRQLGLKSPELERGEASEPFWPPGYRPVTLTTEFTMHFSSSGLQREGRYV